MKISINIQEEIEIKEEYYKLSEEIYELALAKNVLSNNKIVVAIGGESGSGKTTTAVSLERILAEKGIRSTTIHMDSYFKLPPKENHQSRVKDLTSVGPQEIDMRLLNEHIASFKQNAESIQIPVLNYRKNLFTQEKLELSEIKVLIVEGVYSFLLEEVDYKIFMIRTYKDTFQNRMNRTREVYDPKVELILDIEHQIVAPLLKQSDVIIKRDYTVIENKSH